VDWESSGEWVGTECFSKNYLAMLCEQLHNHGEGVSHLQSTFQVTLLVPHPRDISELLDKHLNYLPDLQE
jgi:hypothetical protein